MVAWVFCQQLVMSQDQFIYGHDLCSECLYSRTSLSIILIFHDIQKSGGCEHQYFVQEARHVHFDIYLAYLEMLANIIALQLFNMICMELDFKMASQRMIASYIQVHLLVLSVSLSSRILWHFRFCFIAFCFHPHQLLLSGNFLLVEENSQFLLVFKLVFLTHCSSLTSFLELLSIFY